MTLSSICHSCQSRCADFRLKTAAEWGALTLCSSVGVERHVRDLSKRQIDRAGISLVELVVAVALLSLVSLAVVQLMNMTERTMIGSQTNLNQQLRSESIASYIYKDFARGELDDAVVSRTYTNDSMPEDLRTGTGVTVVSLYGKANRFNGVDPRCPLERGADPADCNSTLPPS